ncbi:uncharacterized protein [Gossypium hirsutum]|uniref:CCHC-type domain-containing protein n=1 Tax=Gossypium hirsutum TaxID=3635 RepID=A0ABM2YNM1_GOSHI|nr:uncharacterized protein LOC121206022 [Gossypium hirsutum]
MENELAQPSINDEEDEVFQIQPDHNREGRGEIFQLVGCFLTASVIHFPAMRSTLVNLWHPVWGVQIRDMGEKMYLFQFFHIMDMERVIKGSPWTFNNYLLLLYKLNWGEDPLQVPLVMTPFWVQIHDVPIGLFFESLAVQMGNFLGVFLKYDGSNLGKENRNFMRIRVQIDVRRPLKRKKQILFSGRRSYVTFKYERLSLFCFFCGRLGHSDSFCETKMALWVEVVEMGWDLSLRAQTRRMLVMNSIWLRDDGEGKVGEEGSSSGSNQRVTEVLSKQFHESMEHDLEDPTLVGEEGKKRSRVEYDNSNENEDNSKVLSRNRKWEECNLILLAAAKRQANRMQ